MKTPMEEGEENSKEETTPMPEDSTRDWSDLTPVLLTSVFRRLDLPCRWTGSSLVCKSWLDASKDPSLFRSFDLEPHFEAAGAGRSDSAGWWTPEFRRRVDSLLRSVAEWGGEAVREVRVRHCSDESLSILSERSPNVEVLSIKNSQNVSDIAISRIALGCSKLRELDVSNCCKISYKSLEVVGQNCPHLVILKRNFLNWLDPPQHAGIVQGGYLRAFPQDDDREASAISKFMPNLEHLELQFSKLSNKGVVSISEGCQNLEVLDLFGCVNLTSGGIEQVSANLKNLSLLLRPNFYMPMSVFQAEIYGHWRLYNESFQANVFQI